MQSIIRFRSPIVKWMNALVWGWPVVFGFDSFEEKQSLRIKLFHELAYDDSWDFAYCKIILSKPRIQIYSAHLSIETRLYGIRYYCYNWFWTCFIIGSTIIFYVQLFIYAIVAIICGYNYYTTKSAKNDDDISTTNPASNELTTYNGTQDSTAAQTIQHVTTDEVKKPDPVTEQTVQLANKDKATTQDSRTESSRENKTIEKDADDNILLNEAILKEKQQKQTDAEADLISESDSSAGEAAGIGWDLNEYDPNLGSSGDENFM